MKHYKVTFLTTYEVEAESKEEAQEKATKTLAEDFFEFTGDRLNVDEILDCEVTEVFKEKTSYTLIEKDAD